MNTTSKHVRTPSYNGWTMLPPRSPAIAKSANIAVPPVGNALEEMLIVPGHMIPTENPHTIHPASPMIGFSEK